MAVYEQSAQQVRDTIKAQAISETVKSAVESIISQAGQTVKLQQFEGQSIRPQDADIVTVPQNVQLTSDPGGKVVLINANAPGANAQFDATQIPRVIVATANSDKIQITGNQPVTVETGGGNDTVTTAQGDDVVVLTGKGKATVDAGVGFDRVEMKGAKATHLINKVGSKVVVNSDVELEAQNVEVIKFEDGKITVVASKKLEGYIARLYEVIFDREADLGGLKYWFDKAEALSKQTVTPAPTTTKAKLFGGTSQQTPVKLTDEQILKEIITGFMNSTEFKNKYANVSNEKFLELLYQGMADRKPDEAGFNYWLDQLTNKGASRADVIYGFVTSQESIKVLGDSGNDYVIDLWIS